MFQQLNILHHIPESYEGLCVPHVQKKKKYWKDTEIWVTARTYMSWIQQTGAA